MTAATPRPESSHGLMDHEPIDDYITAPTQHGNFAQVVERNVIFEADGAIFQVRIQRSGSHDYALNAPLQLTGTVKAHETYKGNKQTVVTRCKLEEVQA